MINIVIAGVGGQGTLLASRILGDLCVTNGFHVKVSEVHGMSQRGGSVVTYVRMSREEPVYSAVVEQGQADVVLAFESLEGLRALPYVKKDGGVMIANTQEIMPMPVILGSAEYPADCLARIAEQTELIALPAAQIAAECGAVKAANVVLLGVLARKLPFRRGEWIAALERNVKPRFLEINKEAFRRGYELNDPAR